MRKRKYIFKDRTLRRRIRLSSKQVKGKRYDIIYLDPPWKYGGTPKIGKANLYYPTMSFKELAKLKIPTADNCLIFMWVVSSELYRCMELAKNHWGFDYITIAFNWHKKRSLYGNYTLPESEICLLFKKGKIPGGRIKKHERQHYSELSTAHSKKPVEFRNRIDRMFPSPKFKKLEMFARGTQPNGWDVFGNEAENSIEL